MTPTILFEDEHYLFLNKPAGLLVHADGRTKEPTLVDWILAHRPDIEGVGEIHDSRFMNHDSPAAERPGIVHRIDRETSGMIVIAKTQAAFMHLKRAFKRRDVRKIYHAFLYGELNQDEGWIDRPIGRSATDFRQFSASRGARGFMREAVTYYHVLGRAPGSTFVEVQPKTGRTHQIRVHFKALNYPIICDKLYAPNKPCLFGLGRVGLHARSIEFVGFEDKKYKVEAPYPDDFAEALRQFLAESAKNS